MELFGSPMEHKHTIPRNDTSSDSQLDFIDPFEEHPVLTGCLIVMLTVMIVLGTFGNVMIIAAVYSSKKLRTPANMLIVNLTTADFIISTFINPFSLIGVINGYEFFYYQSKLCSAIAVFCLTSCVSSCFTITAIAINRYVALCKHEVYSRVFSWKNTNILCVAIWVLSLLVDLPTLVGWSRNAYDKKAMICLYDRTHTHTYTVFFAVISVLIPGIVIFICYLKIFLFVSQKKRQIWQNMQSGSKELVLSARAQRDEIRLARTLFFIFMVFFSTWGIYALTVVVDVHDRAPKIWHAIIIQVAHFTNSGINFIIYGVTHQMFREAFTRLLCPKSFWEVSWAEHSSAVNPLNNQNVTAKRNTQQLNHR